MLRCASQLPRKASSISQSQRWVITLHKSKRNKISENTLYEWVVQMQHVQGLWRKVYRLDMHKKFTPHHYRHWLKTRLQMVVREGDSIHSRWFESQHRRPLWSCFMGWDSKRLCDPCHKIIENWAGYPENRIMTDNRIYNCAKRPPCTWSGIVMAMMSPNKIRIERMD